MAINMRYLLPFVYSRDTKATMELSEAVSLGDNIILHTKNDSYLHGTSGPYEHACGHVLPQALGTSCKKGAIPCSDPSPPYSTIATWLGES